MSSIISGRHWKKAVWWSGAYLAVAGSLVGIYAWLDPNLLESIGWKTWALIVAVLVYLLGLIVAIAIDNPGPVEASDLDEGPEDLYRAVLELTQSSYDAGEYREVVRLGDALSRPLFESGEFRVRLTLGRLTEEAAAHIGATDVQYRSLIDAIGWSLIELGDFETAAREIKHGLSLAIQAGDPFYCSKANRHLGAIARRRGRNEDAREFYEAARIAATEIADARQSREMEAGITYASAHLEFSQREYDGALVGVDRAAELFRGLGDVYRLDMALVLKADIEVAMGARSSARDTYRSVIQSSRQNSESVHYARAVIGLAELLIADGQQAEAAKVLERLDPSHVASMPAFADRFRSAQAASAQRASHR